MADKIHKFEEAGLGTAPFRLIGYVERRATGQPDQNGRIVGSPGQPLGHCHYCGTVIADCFVIRSSDGKVFEVGCVCVGKTGDAGLKKVVDKKARELKRERQLKRENQRIAGAKVRLEKNPEIQAALKAKPHPYEWAEKQGLTLLDWANWMMDNAGQSGRMKVVRTIDKILKGDK